MEGAGIVSGPKKQASSAERGGHGHYNPADSEHRIGIALTDLRRLYSSWFEYLYEPGALLEPGQHDVLWSLVNTFPGECRMTELAMALHIDRSSATRAVDKLVAKGLVERTPDPDDRRAFVVKPSLAGRRLFERLSRPASQRWRDTLHGVFDPDELSRLADWLERLVAAEASAVRHGAATERERD